MILLFLLRDGRRNMNKHKLFGDIMVRTFGEGGYFSQTGLGPAQFLEQLLTIFGYPKLPK